ncbi:uncharacterized protein K452DRAFT_115437 [Aplosporella prunicola CBS 121167]|uniref:Uncharacterized protein n=1 Tax=Aplosporella prunicola CBS 121167 TaxID=1176127 RepID=A0A6A6AYN2_9PEZI|nr:uncharacterized protein K452DRAFT_115437 [Aplosporella prunicola CBS 121167]KAF2137042.1 hypothetical protein K452DRAFT_115437 [Aplosporella prunicola CBS 121167]
MRSSLLLAAVCAPSALAFPWMTPEGMEALLKHPEARAAIDQKLKAHHRDDAASELKKRHEPRQLGTGLLGGVVSLLGGSVEAVVDNLLGLIPTDKAVDGLTRFPEGMAFVSVLCKCLSAVADCCARVRRLPLPGAWRYRPARPLPRLEHAR